MPYLWLDPANAGEREYSAYDYESSPDRERLTEGALFDVAAGMPRFRFLGNATTLSRLDALPNDAMLPLVNARLAAILRECAARDVQFVAAEVLLSGGPAPGEFFVVNATRLVRGIDWEYSVADRVQGSDAILGFQQLRFRPDCLGTALMAREEEYLEHLLVSPRLVATLREAKIRGVEFKRAEAVVW